MESVVEYVDVASAEAACVSDAVSKLEGHLVHEAERAAARGFRETNGVGVKLGKRVGRKALCAKLGFDGRDEVVADRADVRAMNAYPEDGEQRAGMREQETLLPIDPEQVQVPVVVGRREFAERDRAAAEQIEHPLRAAHDHPANLPASTGEFHAAASYSWTSPPRRSRRCTLSGSLGRGIGAERSGGTSPRA